MKKIVIVLALMSTYNALQAQDEENVSDGKKGGFKKENMFVGGNLDMSFSNSSTALGISPYVGYSINKYLDVAVSTNINYISLRDYQEYGDKARQTVYGPGAFVRVFPFRFIFAQAQYEFNFIKFRYIPAKNSTFYSPFREGRDAHSFLVGGGYAGGREGVGSSFYYISVMWDIGSNSYSPYKDELNRALPIFRIGYNIALFQGGGRRRR
ncbi:MAG: hypothetical protein JNM14_11000 [Ferruginibacter sp.]|nr:hypothetical protein [Ferruginibacter sp.]